MRVNSFCASYPLIAPQPQPDPLFITLLDLASMFHCPPGRMLGVASRECCRRKRFQPQGERWLPMSPIPLFFRVLFALY